MPVQSDGLLGRMDGVLSSVWQTQSTDCRGWVLSSNVYLTDFYVSFSNQDEGEPKSIEDVTEPKERNTSIRASEVLRERPKGANEDVTGRAKRSRPKRDFDGER